jgi:hypothetical protein
MQKSLAEQREYFFQDDFFRNLSWKSERGGLPEMRNLSFPVRHHAFGLPTEPKFDILGAKPYIIVIIPNTLDIPLEPPASSPR